MPETLRIKINRLYLQKEQIDKEIEELRAECKHEKYIVQMYQYRPGSMSPHKMCAECDFLLPGITEEEYDKCQNNYDDFIKECRRKAGYSEEVTFKVPF